MSCHVKDVFFLIWREVGVGESIEIAPLTRVKRKI
jgi:hypothetical protein